jgi:hypothetical protein
MLVVTDGSGPGQVVVHAHCPEDGRTYGVRVVSWAGANALRYLAVGGSAQGAIRRVDLSTGATTEWAVGPGVWVASRHHRLRG